MTQFYEKLLKLKIIAAKLNFIDHGRTVLLEIISKGYLKELQNLVESHSV